MKLSRQEKQALMRLIGNNVRRYRIERGLTQEELSHLTDVNISTVTRIEGGMRMMSIPLLRSVAAALQVSSDALLSTEKSNSAMTNIQVKLAGQSPEFLTRLGRIIQVFIDEYGDKGESSTT